MNRLAELVLVFVFALSACLAACGSSTPAKPVAAASAPAADLPPLPRSSLAAVLLHRDELKLTDDQVKALHDLDEELAERAKALSERPSGGAHPDGGVASHRGGGAGAGGGAGGGGGRMHMTGGRGGGRGMGGGGFHGTSSGQPKGVRSLEERLDDADTRAYLQAEEEILDPAQRDRAREIAEQYREDLYDRRAKTASDKE
jgi:hypothetical protein